MKIRTDFVTNSSSSSFVVEINIELKNGRSIKYEDEGYDPTALYIHTSPREMGQSKSIQELANLIKNSMYLDEYKTILIRCSGAFVKKIQNISSMDEIKCITTSGKEIANGQEYYECYKYNLETGEYTYKEDGDWIEELNGSRGGALCFNDCEYLADEEKPSTEVWSVTKQDDAYIITGYYGEEINIVIPSRIGDKKITKISEIALKDAMGIVNVTISDGIEVIKYNAFENCKNLKNVTIPQSVTYVASNAFLNCKNLKKVVILAKQISINKSSFKDCKKIKIYTVKGSEAERFAIENNIPLEFL